MANKYRVVAGVMVVAWMVLRPAFGAEAVVPGKLRAAIAAAYPEARIVEPRDVERDWCGASQGENPGVVAGDFNGDGIQDYAVFLAHGAGGLTLAVLLGEPNGQFRAVTLRDADPYLEHQHLPAREAIRLKEPGTISDAGKYDPAIGGFATVTLDHPAVTLYSCEEQPKVFYWNGKGFSMATVAH